VCVCVCVCVCVVCFYARSGTCLSVGEQLTQVHASIADAEGSIPTPFTPCAHTSFLHTYPVNLSIQQRCDCGYAAVLLGIEQCKTHVVAQAQPQPHEREPPHSPHTVHTRMSTKNADISTFGLNCAAHVCKLLSHANMYGPHSA
jgi:hypothetical protein